MDTQPLVVWTEIPVTNLEKAVAFYTEVFQGKMAIDDTGPNPLANFSSDMTGVGGHLYDGKPASDGNGPTVHIATPDKLETCAKRCEIAGGTMTGPIIEIPPGRFQYATDPDGNSIGLFEPRG